MTSLNSFEAFNSRLCEFIAAMNPPPAPTAIELSELRQDRSADFSPLPEVLAGPERGGLKSALLNSMAVPPVPPEEGSKPSDTHCRFPSWEGSGVGWFIGSEAEFNQLALALFALQFAHVEPYRRLCEARRITPDKITLWSEIPAVPATAFTELDLS